MNTKCQVFTPNNYVRELLDSIDYTDNLYGKKILENSCGDGNILVEIIQRYIDDCRKQGLLDFQIVIGLENDIYGVEIDPVQYNKCVVKLDELSKKNGISKVEWNIINSDYLKWKESHKFQYIVGNPPYITYQELKTEERELLRENFDTCEKGKFDYCYAFIEKSVKSLEKNGKMAYLIPSSIFKTVFGEKLRDYIKPFIQEIRDYTQDKMFDNALVKSAIMVLNKGKKSESLKYYDVANRNELYISVSDLKKKWFFTTNNTSGTRRFGDYFKVSHVVATLLNEAFVIQEETYNELADCYQCSGHNIEKQIVRETATPRSLRYGKIEKIIFPYNYEKGRVIRYTEEEFEHNFPGANAYLSDFRKQLDMRKKDSNSLWFEYGRSQALSGLNKCKLLISTVITEKVTVYKLKKKCIPYAGMYIVPKSGNKEYDLDYAKEILESKEFMTYVEDVGIHISGVSLRITCKDIENYMY